MLPSDGEPTPHLSGHFDVMLEDPSMQLEHGWQAFSVEQNIVAGHCRCFLHCKKGTGLCVGDDHDGFMDGVADGASDGCHVGGTDGLDASGVNGTRELVRSVEGDIDG